MTMFLKCLIVLASLAALAACTARGPTDPLCLPNPEAGPINCWTPEAAES
jgi:predicted small lipoprotein YifL